MPTILITGASSGLGLGFLTYYSSQSSTNVLALDVVELPPDFSSGRNIEFHKVDITSPSSLQAISETLSTQSVTIDTLIHSAGIRGLVKHVVEGKCDVAASEAWEVMDHATMMHTFEVNTWGTFNVIRTFLPLLRQSKSSTAISTPSKVVILSSRMGSVSSNTTGGGYAYRASKAGLNAVVKSFAIDVPDVVFLLLHPGRVETGLVGWKEEGAFSVEEVLGDCVRVIERVGEDKEEGWSGRFVDRWGKEIGW